MREDILPSQRKYFRFVLGAEKLERSVRFRLFCCSKRRKTKMNEVRTYFIKFNVECFCNDRICLVFICAPFYCTVIVCHGANLIVVHF